MKKFDLFIFFISILVLTFEKKIWLVLTSIFILLDIFIKVKKNRNIIKDNNNEHYFKHLNLKYNKGIIINLALMFVFGVILVSVNQTISFNYWKNATVNKSLFSLIIFIITIFVFFVFSTDSYFYDIFFFKKYFYPTKNEIIKNIFNDIKKINIKNIKLYNDFELYRIFENLMTTHDRINYEVIRLNGRFLYLLISSIGIMIFSFKWFYKIILSSYFLQIYIVANMIDKIKNERDIYADKQHDIFKKINYIFSDVDNFIINNKKGELNHSNKLDNLINHENDLDMKIRKLERMPQMILRIWTFFVYTLIAFQVFYLTNLTKMKLTYAAKLAIGATNISWIGMNFSSIYQSISEVYMRLGLYNSLSSKINMDIKENYMDQFNEHINIIDGEIYLFNIKLDKKLINLRAASGKGKTTLLDCLFYNNKYLTDKGVYLQQSSNIDMKNKTPITVITGLYKNPNNKIAEKCLNIVSNTIPINEKIINLSGGERQRILLASSLYKVYIYDAKFFIMDEGDTNIDSDIYNRILLKILENFKDLKIIYTTHKDDMKELENLQVIDITELV